MNVQMANALMELRKAKALKVPNPVEIEKATDGTSWSGQTADGQQWEFIKNKIDSYNCKIGA